MKEAKAKRSETINTMLTEAEKQAMRSDFQSARGRPCKVNPEHTGILTCLATKRPTRRFLLAGFVRMLSERRRCTLRRSSRAPIATPSRRPDEIGNPPCLTSS